MRFSHYITIGDYRGFKIFKDGPALRINLGWAAICFANIDVEELIECQLNDLHYSDASKEVYDEAISKYSELNQETELLRRTNENLERQITRLKDEITEQEHHIDEIDDERIDAQDENDVLKEDKKELETKLKDKETEIDNLLRYFRLKPM